MIYQGKPLNKVGITHFLFSNTNFSQRPSECVLHTFSNHFLNQNKTIPTIEEKILTVHVK